MAGAAVTSSLTTASRRSIYTQYHATIHDFSKGKSPSEVLNGEENYYHMNFVNVPIIEASDAKFGGDGAEAFDVGELGFERGVVAGFAVEGDAEAVDFVAHALN